VDFIVLGHLSPKRLDTLAAVLMARVPGSRVQGAGFRVQGAGFRVQGSGFRAQGSGLRVQGSGFTV